MSAPPLAPTHEKAARLALARTVHRPQIAVVLGSGLGSFAGEVEDALSLPWSELPGFASPTVEGHAGRLVIGRVAGVPVAVMAGRVHAYEGRSPAEVVFPVRVLHAMGVRQLVVTNAAGGIRPDLVPGTLAAISDHINFTGANPLTGPPDERLASPVVASPVLASPVFAPSTLASPFVDMTEAYSPRLRQLAKHAAAELALPLPEGVYIGVGGPSYETPAEIRAFRTLGADLVGMSTVHEVIAARHLGMEVLGISCVTNPAAGVGKAPIDHAEVMQTGRRVEADFARLLRTLLPRVLPSAS